MKTSTNYTGDSMMESIQSSSFDVYKVLRIEMDILAYVGKRGKHTTFAELSEHVEGFNGEYNYTMKYSNMVVWTKMSKEAIKAIIELNRKGSIHLSPASPWVYYHDGTSLRLPIAERLMAYKKPLPSPSRNSKSTAARFESRRPWQTG